MNKRLVKLRLHGDLGESIGKEWEFAVSSVKEAISFLNTMTNNSFNNYFMKNNRLNAYYRVLINGEDFKSPEKTIDNKNIELLYQTNLMYTVNNLEIIDIVPFIENSDSKVMGIIAMVVGAVLVIVGAIFGQGELIAVGLALFMAGVAALLVRLPEFQNFRNIDKFGNQSYLFSGPTNIVGEGGPVPVGYGRVIVGSQVISSAYQIRDYQTFRDSSS